MMLWFFDDYYYYAVCIFIISATSIISTLIETKQTMRKLREMSKFVCDVRVFRGGLWRYTTSEDLVPGDVFEISDPNLHTYPCDALLLSGDCIVNESILTGESIPVSKSPITDAALRKMDFSAANFTSDFAKYVLFSGTRIVRVRKAKGNGSLLDDVTLRDEGIALAMAIRTGFNTTKGALIRSILFPKPIKFKFYRDSFRFIAVLAVIAAIGFIISAYNFIKMGVNPHLIIVRALDLITVVVPPALPATMSIGTSFAIRRLSREGIYCISPSRVNIGGKINVMCFDKTGTLTEEGLDVLGVRYVDQKTNRLSELHKTVETLSPSSMNFIDPLIEVDTLTNSQNHPPILYAMTTCHSLKLVDNGLIGDPLDLKMFEFTKWILEESGQTSSRPINTGAQLAGTGGIVPTVVRPPDGRQFDLSDVFGSDSRSEGTKSNPFLELGIIRTFEFVSALRRMSVIVKRLRSTTMEVYVKGAPEIMKEICRKETFPENYDDLLYYYTHHGFRVIACATKSVNDLNWMKAQKIKREQVEQDLQFLGFIIFENKLKPATETVIKTLQKANIRQIMCTGDSLLTAISVSRECSLVNKSSRIYLPRFVEGSTSPRANIVWENLEDSNDVLDTKALRPTISLPLTNQTPEYPTMDAYDFSLAISGEAFRWMVDHGDEKTLSRMLVKGRIFARMSPDEKHELVEELQKVGYCVGFCGDGANDCGALKAADVGLSLSEAEASVAAPFTSRSTDTGCVLEVIREGRAALVTSFSCFKYMALYSIIQFTTISLLYAFSSNLGDFQFLYIDLFLILPIAVLMGRTEPYPRIHAKRPTASLVSKKVLTSLVGQVTIQSGFQFFIYSLVRMQPWYEKPTYDPDSKNITCFENTALFLVSCFQYISIAAVFSVGPPYRKSMDTNVPFIITTIFLTLVSFILTIFPPKTLAENILELRLDVPSSFRWVISFIAFINFLLSWCCEKYVFPHITQWVGGGQSNMKKKHKKLYKRIEEDR